MPVSTPKISPIMIEREAELAAVEGLLSEAIRGDGRVAVIGGDAGSGKTRLVTAVEGLAVSRGCGSLRGVCSERDRDVPFAGVIDMLSRGSREGTVERELEERSGWAMFAAPTLGAWERNRNLPAPLGSPGLARRRQLESILQLLEGLSAERPFLMVIEDGHWADPSTLDLIEILPRRLPGSRVLALITARTDEPDSGWRRCLVEMRRSRRIVEIGLAPLSPSGVADMLGNLVEAPVPPGAAALVFARSGGNPLFVEELAATVRLHDSPAWSRSLGGNEPVPTKLADLVLQRLEGLPRRARAIADLVAVAGGPCSFDRLLAASGYSRDVVASSVRLLVDRFIVVELRGSGESRVMFRHALTRDAIYDRLIDPQRRVLHHAIGAVIAATGDQGDPAVAAELGRHFHAAGDWDQAILYAVRAAAAAALVHATAESLVHLRRALEAAVALDHPDQAEILRRCGQACDLLGAFDLAREQAEAALVLARRNGDRRTEIDVLDDLARYHARRDYLVAEGLSREALALSIEIGDLTRRGRSLNRLGNVLTNLGQFEAGRALHEEAYRHFLALGDDGGAAASIDLTAMALYLVGDVPVARAAFHDAARRFTALGDVEGVASALASSGLYLAVIDGPCATDAPPATYGRDAAEGLRLCREIEWRSGEIYALVALACAALGDGEYGRAGDQATAAHRLAVEFGHKQWSVIASFVLGLRLADLLDHECALRHFEEGLTMATALGSGQWCERLLAWIGQCYVRCGELETAETTLRRVTVSEGGRPGSIGQRRVCMAMAELELLAGRPEAAEPWMDRILGGPTGPRPAEAMLLHGRIFAARGMVPDADAALLEARRLAEDVGPRTMLWRVAAARSRLWSGLDHGQARLEAQRTRNAIARLAATIEIESERIAFRSALEVRRWLAPAGSRRTCDSVAPDGLTKRERDVARAVAMGLANKEIAHTLGIAAKTVEMHVGSCLGKLGFASRAQLAVWAVGEGLVVPTDPARE